MRDHALYGIEASAAREVVQRDAQLQLAHQGALEIGQQVEGRGDDAVRRVLRGHEPELDLAPLHRREDVGDRAQPAQLRRAPEVLDGGQVREGALRAEVGDLDAVLERAGARHDLAEDRRDGAVRKGTGVRGAQALVQAAAREQQRRHREAHRDREHDEHEPRRVHVEQQRRGERGADQPQRGGGSAAKSRCAPRCAAPSDAAV